MTEADCHNCRALLSSDASSDFCAEAGRYALYLQYGCPFAQRANIVVHLKGLQNIISIVALDPTKTPEGFRFTGKLGTFSKDPYYGFSHIRQLYWKVDPDRKGPFTIPLLWDRKKEIIVNNESGDIMRMLYECFDYLLPHLHLRCWGYSRSRVVRLTHQGSLFSLGSAGGSSGRARSWAISLWGHDYRDRYSTIYVGHSI